MKPFEMYNGLQDTAQTFKGKLSRRDYQDLI